MKHILWLLMIISDPQHLFLWRYKKTIRDMMEQSIKDTAKQEIVLQNMHIMLSSLNWADP